MAPNAIMFLSFCVIVLCLTCAANEAALNEISPAMEPQYDSAYHQRMVVDESPYRYHIRTDKRSASNLDKRSSEMYQQYPTRKPSLRLRWKKPMDNSDEEMMGVDGTLTDRKRSTSNFDKRSAEMYQQYPTRKPSLRLRWKKPMADSDEEMMGVDKRSAEMYQQYPTRKPSLRLRWKKPMDNSDEELMGVDGTLTDRKRSTSNLDKRSADSREDIDEDYFIRHRIDI
ncbi:uncharacterized protein LOC129763004 isoform X3 [Toxorhynchites rutilus septentrionalis]|uniref:uncharacterized protein LOC129763004 isoform X3 n=1 Tax=Toxorhynchites rutilus septentrionalis TaxID=329112 RepID=UPI00247834B2|nr:uncharacterized protein LOC129763004 isoform X3 [Toxorhynchites rutilus septentrionalis]